MNGLFSRIQDAGDWVLAFAKAHPESTFTIAFAVSFAESFVGLSFLVPGFSILIGLGFLIGATGMSFWPIWLAAAVGAIMGDWISYWIGHRYHEHALDIWPISRYREQMQRALAFFARWGVWAIFIGRFMGPFRATVPIVAGISRMAFWPFQVANVSSALLWSAVLLAPGTAAWPYLKGTWRWLFG